MVLHLHAVWKKNIYTDKENMLQRDNERRKTNFCLERQSHKFANAQALFTRTPRFLSSKAKQTVSARSMRKPVSYSSADKVTNIPNARKPAAFTALSSSRTAPNSIVIINIIFCLCKYKQNVTDKHEEYLAHLKFIFLTNTWNTICFEKK